VDFFDADCVVGRRGNVPPWGLWRFDDFLLAMENYGIRRALAYHALARESDPRGGNALLLEALAKSERLEASYVVEPLNRPGTQFAEAFFKRYVVEAGVRAVRVFPHKHGYAGGVVMLGDIFTAAERMRLPVFYHVPMRSTNEDLTDWKLVDEICKAHPRLRLVLLGVGSPGVRALLRMLAVHRRLMVGLTNLRAWGIVEKINAAFGPERLLFATGAPEFDPGYAMGMVTGAEIPESHKRLIAGGNLQRLLFETTL